MPQEALAPRKPEPAPDTLNESLRLERTDWRNWVFFASTVIIITLGLSSTVVMATRGASRLIWPWDGTQEALLTGLSSLIIVLVLYLSREQRRVYRLRRELVAAQGLAAERLRQHLERLRVLREVSRTIGLVSDPRSVFDAITQSCLETFGADRVSLMLLDRDKAELEVRSAAGTEDLESVTGARLRVGQGVAGWVAEHQVPIILGGHVDPARYPGLAVKHRTPSVAMVVPVLAREELVGVLNVSSHAEGTDFTEADLELLLVFAEDAGISCRHAEQIEWMRRTIQRLDSDLIKCQGDAARRPAA